MTPTPTYSEQERSRVYATIVYIAEILNKKGINTIIDATGNRRHYREVARKTLKNFALAYAKCPFDTCVNREQKRDFAFGAPEKIYKNMTVPGLNVPYEEPLNADVAS